MHGYIRCECHPQVYPDLFLDNNRTCNLDLLLQLQTYAIAYRITAQPFYDHRLTGRSKPEIRKLQKNLCSTGNYNCTDSWVPDYNLQSTSPTSDHADQS